MHTHAKKNQGFSVSTHISPSNPRKKTTCSELSQSQSSKNNNLEAQKQLHLIPFSPKTYHLSNKIYRVRFLIKNLKLWLL